MKKKLLMCLLVGCLTASLFGCGSADKAKEALAEVAEEKEDDDKDKDDEKEDEEEKEDKDEKKKDKEKEDDEAKDEKKDEEKEDEEKVEKKKSSDNPVLGDEDIEDYDGFEYLYGELLMTDAEENKETGKMERHKLTVFIPQDEYASISGNRAYVNSMGVHVEVELNPYIRYDSEDYLPEENLQFYLENNYDPFYTNDYKDMVISEIEEVGENAYRATVEYCEYSKWDDDYSTVFCTYFYKELESGAIVLVEVSVDEKEVTGKAPRMIEELEAFYEFDINWDADKAQQKREAYIASGGDHTYSTGYLLFELPENWDEVTEGVDYDENVYAPEGDIDFSGCMISFYREFMDDEVDVRGFVENEEETRTLMEESLEMDITDFSVEMVDTVLGEAAKITYTASGDDIDGQGQCYFVSEGYYVYTIQAYQLEDATEDPFIVLDGILQSGQVKEW